MKLIAFALIFCFTFNALAVPVSEIEKLYDNYNYSLTVEWDQKDQKFYDQLTDKFIKDITEQIIVNGVSQTEIFSMVEKKIGNKELVDSIKLKFSLMPKMSPEQLVEFLNTHSKEFYSRGASWNDTIEVIAYVTGGALLLGTAIWFAFNYDCVRYEYRYSNSCGYYNCYRKVCVQYAKN